MKGRMATAPKIFFRTNQNINLRDKGKTTMNWKFPRGNFPQSITRLFFVFPQHFTSRNFDKLVAFLLRKLYSVLHVRVESGAFNEGRNQLLLLDAFCHFKCAVIIETKLWTQFFMNSAAHSAHELNISLPTMIHSQSLVLFSVSFNHRRITIEFSVALWNGVIYDGNSNDFFAGLTQQKTIVNHQQR